jgi:hypothetical protein
MILDRGSEHHGLHPSRRYPPLILFYRECASPINCGVGLITSDRFTLREFFPPFVLYCTYIICLVVPWELKKTTKALLLQRALYRSIIEIRNNDETRIYIVVLDSNNNYTVREILLSSCPRRRVFICCSTRTAVAWYCIKEKYCPPNAIKLV